MEMKQTDFTSREKISTHADCPPVAADLAQENVSLLDFVRHGGRNMFRVIPDATLTSPYVKGPHGIHWLCSPELVCAILHGKGRHFPKAKFTRDILESAIKGGIMLAEGDAWKAQRHRYAPLFAARNLPVLAENFSETGEVFAQEAAEESKVLDVADFSKRATLSNISRVMFSGPGVVAQEDVRAGLSRYFEHISTISLFDMLGVPKWVPRLSWLRGSRPVSDMRDLTASVINARRAERHEEPEDFLDLMIEVLDSDSESLDQTIANLMTFVVAGHETAANTLSWGFYLLARYPEMQEKIRQEIKSVRPDGAIGISDINTMPTLMAHVRETLRLYPAASVISREVRDPLTIGDVKLSRGDTIFIPVYSLHRHHALWDEPDRYRPERFLDAKFPRGQFIPFGDGPRICIGAQYAESEIAILTAAVLRRVHLADAGCPVPKPVLTFTMRPEGPLKLRISPL